MSFVPSHFTYTDFPITTLKQAAVIAALTLNLTFFSLLSVSFQQLSYLSSKHQFLSSILEKNNASLLHDSHFSALTLSCIYKKAILYGFPFSLSIHSNWTRALIIYVKSLLKKITQSLTNSEFRSLSLSYYTSQ